MTSTSYGWCDSCGAQGVPLGPHAGPYPVCELCGTEQIEPFKEGWDESD